MQPKQFADLLDQIGQYENNHEMVTKVLKMRPEKKFFCLCAMTYLLTDDNTPQRQMMLFAKVVAHDLADFKGKEKNDLYNTIINGTFKVIDRTDSYDIGCNHDSIHEFLVDRLQLN